MQRMQPTQTTKTRIEAVFIVEIRL